MLSCRDELPGKGSPPARTFEFAADAVRGWKLTALTLFLHLEEGSPQPAKLAVSVVCPDKACPHGLFPVKVLGEGWIQVTMDARLSQALGKTSPALLAIRPGAAKFHGQRPAHFQPYILAEGDPSASP